MVGKNVLYCCVAFYFMSIQNLFTHFLEFGHGSFLVWAVITKAAINIFECLCFWCSHEPVTLKM